MIRGTTTAWITRLISGALATLAAGTIEPAATVAAEEPDFGTYWHSGGAELDGYRLTIHRYGQPRTGQCVMIYVTEPFSASRRVKVEDLSRNPDDLIDVLKLNLIRDFQTGIYDYNTMVSVFDHSGDFEPVKITFTGAEWCGHVYEELTFSDGRVFQWLFSYFEGESSSQALEPMSNGVVEDNLFILLRGLRGPFLQPGTKRTTPFLPAALHRRLTHRKLGWTSALIERQAEPEKVTVPAGTFDSMVYVVRAPVGRVGTFHIEQDYPHRVVRWEWKRAADANEKVGEEGNDTGELTGTARLEYWKLHDNGHERHLEQLGLKR